MIAKYFFLTLLPLFAFNTANASHYGYSANGIFTVAGTDTKGTEFKNHLSCSMTLEYKISGFWQFNPNEKWHSAAGFGSTAPDFFVAPKLPSGSIIIKVGNSEYRRGGTRGVIKLASKQKISFLMNDSVSGYYDNNGAVLVRWFSGAKCDK